MTQYILDTSSLVSSGRKLLFSFGSDDVVIPLSVVQQLENLRHNPHIGISATSVVRTIDALQKKGDIREGVSLGEGFGTLRVEVNHVKDIPEALSTHHSSESRTVTVAFNLQKDIEDEDVILVTNDTTMSILASIVGVETEVVEDENAEVDKFINYTQTYQITEDEMSELYSFKSVDLQHEVPINTGVVLKSPSGASALAISRKGWMFDLATDFAVGAYTGRSKEQKFAIDHLTNENIGVVSLSGTAGSGKSFLMIGAALDLVRDESTPYKKIVIFRPVNPVGGQYQDLGYLPGTMAEKLEPHVQAVYDTLGTLVSAREVEEIRRKGLIEFASISHVRGRTLANCVVICDELQNVETSTILTLISRLGVNARVFIGWDTAQRDAKYIGKYDGIFKIVRKLYGNKLFAHVSLKKSERSAISEMVSGLLDEL